MDERIPIVRQGVMTLPFFDDEVPVLYLTDGTGYIPVVALCRMLGLSPETHIPRWRRLFLWVHARKLPLRTEARGTRMVWCLHLGALLFWCSSFNWSLVSPERRVQLRQATDAGLKHLEQAHQEMLTRYRQTRHLLFRFLTNYADAQTQLQQVAARMHRRLDVASSATLDSLLAQGNALIEEATTHARAMPQDQAAFPSWMSSLSIPTAMPPRQARCPCFRSSPSRIANSSSHRLTGSPTGMAILSYFWWSMASHRRRIMMERKDRRTMTPYLTTKQGRTSRKEHEER